MRSSSAAPKHWARSIQTALVHVMSLAHYALVHTRSWAANSGNDRVRLSARSDQLDHEIRLLREEIRIKDARVARIPALRRPHYQPTERLAILELRALRGWSLAQTAKVFYVTPVTVASWDARLDEEGPNALLRTSVPVNKYPDFIRYLGATPASALSSPGQGEDRPNARAGRPASGRDQRRSHASREPSPAIHV